MSDVYGLLSELVLSGKKDIIIAITAVVKYNGNITFINSNASLA